jgi:hypothetical protein
MQTTLRGRDEYLVMIFSRYIFQTAWFNVHDFTETSGRSVLDTFDLPCVMASQTAFILYDGLLQSISQKDVLLVRDLPHCIFRCSVGCARNLTKDLNEPNSGHWKAR